MLGHGQKNLSTGRRQHETKRFLHSYHFTQACWPLKDEFACLEPAIGKMSQQAAKLLLQR